MTDTFHGLEEYIAPVDYAAQWREALAEAEAERNKKVRDSIRALLVERKELESQLKATEKKLEKVNNRLKGYASGRVQEVES